MKPLFLISNDDGIQAAGIKHLANAARKFGDVYVVAPKNEQSARSQAITLATPLRVEDHGNNEFAVEGTPADCILLGVKKILPRKPDWIFSGINHGGNLGQDVLYSGTIGAALEGALCGIPSIAFSYNGYDFHHFDAAEKVAENIIKNIEHFKLPEKRILNINIPNIPLEKMAGFMFTSLGTRIYEDRVYEKQDPRGRPYYWLGGYEHYGDHIPETDCALVSEGHVTMSILKACLYDEEATENMQRDVADFLLKDSLITE